MLKAHVLLTTTNDPVYVFDDVFPSHDQAHYRKWLETAAYKFMIAGDAIVDDNQQRALSAVLDDDQQKALNLTNSSAWPHFEQVLDGRKLVRMWCNLTTYMTDCHYHVDGYAASDLTWLYYANTTWDRNWGGETIICNSYGEVEVAVACKPNRVVVFPSRLYHRVANLSTSAPPHRFVIVGLYRRE